MIAKSSYSDQELIAFLKADQAFAFNEIYDRYWKTLFGISYNRLKDIQAAEDVVHDVLLSIWNNRDRLEIINLKAYLATATKYMILRKLRKEQHQMSYLQDLKGVPEAESASLEDRLHYKNILLMLEEEIDCLPEKCKLVFKYSRTENLSIKEIADKLEISSSTVENHLNKALGRLRLVLKHANTTLFSFFL
ncbi:RNA polymerase sigma factor [Mucilaginibacter segetis]|uniref:RNA polymerase sigma-70 factor n=1 Tax=Mucilaginibacter segetis TaxID=2793071 RepID=A0A934PSC1_9SPHI|nr:RNA polymerase sigma-70 factor [Mucilaginibacter segetis]MBK0379909.1 RNA polymerase sigma-70 factor [Mucilaginibacter segetis]